MTLASEVLARRMRLARAQTHDVVCEHDLPATMDDGAVLLADRWVAREATGTAQSTVLIRSPYGRGGFVGLLFGRLLAERGLQVVIQSVRGTFGSEGQFAPFDERADGLATLAWLRRQPWHGGRIGMMGPSYLGLVQWAVAPDAGDDLAALAIQVSASEFYDQTYAGGSLSLETIGSWMALVAAQESRLAPVAINRALRKLESTLGELPLAELDERATGAPLPWFRAAFDHPGREDAYWAARDFSARVGEVRAAVQFVGGWYDILLPWMLEDYAALRAAGHDPQLQIGPWTHTAPGLVGAGHREGIAWLRRHLLGDDGRPRSSPVQVLITGERSGGGWRELASWPPPGTTERRLWLGSGRRLDFESPGLARGGGDGAGGRGDGYRYDPADPTPSLGGPVLLARHPVVDNRELESRGDVLTYSTEPLARTMEAVGPVRVELWASASSDYFDLFARVCDVDPAGRSWNVCDALARIAPGRFERSGDGVWPVAFDLWPIGHRFDAGHRIRLQVSSGAHPRYARNPGTGEDPVTATELSAVEIEILRDGAHPSALVLPAAADA
ncbi:MAG TPA: CocE/NonD family hydrolase [Solirubrobacteraceae bacterium]